MIDRKILKALKIAGDTHTPEDVLAAVDRGDMQLWGNSDAIVVTEPCFYPQYSVVQIAMVAGKLDAVMALQPDIEKFGQSIGSRKLRMIGREGWIPILPKYGWRQDRRVMFEKDL